MKSYKEFINESRSYIESICKKYGITNYTINSDVSIDVDGDVNLIDNNLTRFPLKFRNVSGYFYCSYNKLTTLVGGPQTVGGDFDCSHNQLTTLEGSPENISGDFYCSHNQLINLEGFPQSVGGNFYCDNNQLINFVGFPEDFESDIYLGRNPVREIYDLFKNVKCIRWINEFDVIQGDKVIMDRLEEVYHQLGMRVVSLKSYKIIN